MSKFKVGDKVIAKKNAPYGITTDGWEGFVTDVNNFNDCICVSGNPTADKTGFIVRDYYFDLLKSSENMKGETITLKYKGNKTIAILKDEDGKYVNSAKARCNPKDKFDKEIGDKLAICRLMNITPKFVNEYMCDNNKDNNKDKNNNKENNIDWEYLKSRCGKCKVGINCRTEESAMNFLEECNKRGVTWVSGRKCNLGENTNFETYKEDTCYIIYDILYDKPYLSYGNMSYCKECNYEIIDFNDIINNVNNINDKSSLSDVTNEELLKELSKRLTI